MSHAHDGPAHLQHHFDTSEQQFSAAKLGMWLFLAQEVLFFGGLFCAYAVYRGTYPETWEYGYQALDKIWGAINTVVLLVSSLTMALAVRAAQTSNKKWLLINLTLTFLCACGFMGIKAVEYSAKIEHGYVFAEGFDYVKLEEHISHEGHESGKGGSNGGDHSADPPAGGEPVAGDTAAATTQTPPSELRSQIAPAAVGPEGVYSPEEVAAEVEPKHDGYLHGERPPNIHLFFGIYFAMTGLHAIHVLAGMIMLAWLFWGALKNRYNAEYFTPVEIGGLYWHLVDLIWIYLFPLFYLIE